MIYESFISKAKTVWEQTYCPDWPLTSNQENDNTNGGTAGGGGIGQKHLTSWSMGACAPKQEKMLSLRHFSRCCSVVGVRERENRHRCVGLCRGGCCGLLTTRGILPSVLSERNWRKKRWIRRWSLDEILLPSQIIVH